MPEASRKVNWFWIIYFFLFLFYNLERIKDFFTPHSDIKFFYSFLYTFDLALFFSYFLNLAQIIINFFHALPLALYALGLSWGRARFWQCLLAGRLIFDLTGHSYEWLGMIALLKTDPDLALLVAAQFLIFYIPSYIGCYQYAFRRK